MQDGGSNLRILLLLLMTYDTCTIRLPVVWTAGLPLTKL